MAYATKDQFRSYVEGWASGDPPDAELDRWLDRAARDVDRALGPMPVRATGFKLDDPQGTNELGLEQWRVDAVSRATCAQAALRILRHRAEVAAAAEAEASDRPAGARSVSGPDFSITYETGGAAGAQSVPDAGVPVALAAVEELSQTGLMTYSAGAA